MAACDFELVRVTRKTAETEIAVTLAPRTKPAPSLDIPNRILSHFVDHFAKGAGIAVTLHRLNWPASWPFDHVLCEDLGQLVGHGVKAIAANRVAATGIPGRASAASSMDDAATTLTIAFESRPRCDWSLPRRADIDGYVDSWYSADGTQTGLCFGTNLRQFLDGFAYGSGATVRIEVQAAGNLHHLYETVFRNLGDAVGAALGTRCTLPGESSGLAGPPRYDVTMEAD